VSRQAQRGYCGTLARVGARGEVRGLFAEAEADLPALPNHACSACREAREGRLQLAADE